MDDRTLLQPDLSTIAVSFHPSHHHDDRVSLEFTDAGSGEAYIVVVDSNTTGHLASLLATAVESPRISAQADQMRAAQRDR